MLIDVGLCSLLGSVTVICSTALSKFIVGGGLCFASPVLYVLVLLLVTRHGQSAALAVPQLGSCASSARAWWLWAAQHPQWERPNH